MIIGLIIAAVVMYGALLAGHRGARRRGERGISVYWNSARGRPSSRFGCPAASGSGTSSDGPEAARPARGRAGTSDRAVRATGPGPGQEGQHHG